MSKMTLSAEDFIEESKKSYLEKNRGVKTASKLKAMELCPWSFFQKYEKEDPRFEEVVKKALTIGNAVDYFVSYGMEAFEERYTILEPKKKRDLMAEKIELINSEGRVLPEIFAELKRQPLFRLHDPKGLSQQRLTGFYETPYGKVPLKATCDRIFYEEGWIDDTKTVSIKGRETFEQACKNSIKKWDYIFSMSFYAVMYYIEMGEFPKKVTLSFVGTNGSLTDAGCKFLQLEITQADLKAGIERVKQSITYYALCEKSGEWKNSAQIYSDNIWKHLNCPHYALNEGSIQEKVIPLLD